MSPKDRVILAATINRHLMPLVEEIAPEKAWATDEPLPDLSHLWLTKREVLGLPPTEPKSELELALEAVAKFVGSDNTKYVKAAKK